MRWHPQKLGLRTSERHRAAHRQRLQLLEPARHLGELALQRGDPRLQLGDPLSLPQRRVHQRRLVQRFKLGPIHPKG